MSQPNRFQQLVADAKKDITEISAQEARAQAASGGAVLIDVREESDWKEGHAEGAKHLSRGVIELEIEDELPDTTQPISATAAAAVDRHSSPKACKRWVTRTCVHSLVGCARGGKPACRRRASKTRCGAVDYSPRR